jgi:aspartate aminotransferase
MHLSSTIKKLSESQTIAMSRKSRELQAQGFDIINLSLGEPDFNVPDVVKQAAISAVENDFSKYMPVPGYKHLQEAIVKKLKRDNNLDFKAENIIVSTGAKQSLANVIMAIADDNEEVLLPAPYWVSYYELIKLARATPVVIPTSIDADFKITPEQFEANINEKTRLMIFSSPCNPSGSVYTHDELAELAKVIEKHPGLYVICDEIYEYINFTGKQASLASFDSIKDRVITVNGVSKGFAMTGYRIGFLAADKWITDACTKMQGQITSGSSSIAQMAAAKAFEEGPSIVQHMYESFERRRELMFDGLSSIPGIKTNKPQGAFYFFPDITALFGTKVGDREINNANDFCLYLLEEANVATVPGEAFGSPDNFRVSYATSDHLLTEAIKRIKEAVEKLS